MYVDSQQIAESVGMYSFETSAATDLNVDIAFRSLIDQIVQNRHLVREARLANQPTVEIQFSNQYRRQHRKKVAVESL